MAPQLYLITPSDPDPLEFPRRLMTVLSGPDVSALLMRRGALEAKSFASMAERVVQIGQAAGAAVLIEDDVDLALRLGADGVHISEGGEKAIRAAISLLKPDGIVGAGTARSRHDAMSFGELGVDYVMFGPLGGGVEAGADELAQWWAETFEVPAVLSDPQADPDKAVKLPVEFIALSDCVWTAADPAATLAAFDRARRTPA